jgi:hypothetical protein
MGGTGLRRRLSAFTEGGSSGPAFSFSRPVGSPAAARAGLRRIPPMQMPVFAWCSSSMYRSPSGSRLWKDHAVMAVEHRWRRRGPGRGAAAGQAADRTEQRAGRPSRLGRRNQCRQNLGPGPALRIDEVEVVRAGDLDEVRRAIGPAHVHRHLVIGGAVHQGDGHRRRGERGGVGDGIALRDLGGHPAHEVAGRAAPQVPLRT